MLVICQKLHICTYNRQNFFPVTVSLRTPLGSSPPLPPPQLEVLTAPAHRWHAERLAKNANHYYYLARRRQ